MRQTVPYNLFDSTNKTLEQATFRINSLRFIQLFYVFLLGPF